jgi:nitrate/nitrite-specific signal transduction histidine kinase
MDLRTKLVFSLVIVSLVSMLAARHVQLRAPVRSEDEIGRLGEAFNRMTDRLLESNRALRVEIDEHRASTAPPPISDADSVTDAD